MRCQLPRPVTTMAWCFDQSISESSAGGSHGQSCSNAVQSGSLGRPFDACPTIRIFSDRTTVRGNLQQSGLADVADPLAGDLSVAWEKAVWDALTTLSAPRCYAARCVLTEIDWYGKRGPFFVFILPRDMNVETAIWANRTDLTPQERVIKAWLNASSQGRQGSSGPGMMADASKNQRGAGDSAVVRFDPLVWDPDNKFRDLANQMYPGRYGPYGASPAEALLHELVHAMRTVKGMTDLTPTSRAGRAGEATPGSRSGRKERRCGAHPPYIDPQCAPNGGALDPGRSFLDGSSDL
jgi:hypothetical protein